MPLKPGKRPLLARWKPYQTVRASTDEINYWWAQADWGVAIICGAVSGNLEAIDFDKAELFGQWKALVDTELPGLVDTLTRHQTPRPGIHVVYRCEEIGGNETLAQEPSETADPNTGIVKPKTLIETRGEGGYIVGPGSPASTHLSCRLYEHVSGPRLAHEPPVTITPAEREAMFRHARSFSTWTGHENDHLKGSQGLPGASERHLPGPASPRAPGSGGSTARPGDDYNQRATWADTIEPHGWTVDHQTGDVVHWCRPGKTGGGTSATTGYCTSTAGGGDLLSVFSSNAYPFEAGKSYSKFSAFTLLNYGAGEFSDAARALAELGYGGDGYGEDEYDGVEVVLPARPPERDGANANANATIIRSPSIGGDGAALTPACGNTDEDKGKCFTDAAEWIAANQEDRETKVAALVWEARNDFSRYPCDSPYGIGIGCESESFILCRRCGKWSCTGCEHLNIFEWESNILLRLPLGEVYTDTFSRDAWRRYGAKRVKRHSGNYFRAIDGNLKRFYVVAEKPFPGSAPTLRKDAIKHLGECLRDSSIARKRIASSRGWRLARPKRKKKKKGEKSKYARTRIIRLPIPGKRIDAIAAANNCRVSRPPTPEKHKPKETSRIKFGHPAGWKMDNVRAFHDQIATGEEPLYGAGLLEDLDWLEDDVSERRQAAFDVVLNGELDLALSG